MSIEKELIQYGITIILEKVFNTKNRYKKYEYLNCIERWVLSMASNGKSVYYKTNMRNPVNQKLAAELNDKKLPKLVKQILSIVHNNLKLKDPTILQNDTRPYSNTKTNNYGWIVDIKVDGSNTYIHIPMSKQKFEIFKMCEITPLTIMFLRYSTLINRGNQWALPQLQFKHLIDMYGVNHEGFASPLNSGLSLFGGKFCSMFKDVDGVFGSLGNFFDQTLYTEPVDTIDLKKINICVDKIPSKLVDPKHWIINPPFINSILGRVSSKILSELNTASNLKINVMIVYVLPTWIDFYGYINIQNSAFLKYTQQLEKGNHFYEHLGGRKIVNSRSTIFVLDTYDDIRDYSNIVKPMML
jgi:hypothetical protein